MDVNSRILSDLTVYTKYANYIPEKDRRETYDEIVTRNKDYWLSKYPDLSADIEEAYKLVYDRKVLPSMRSMQFAGPAMDKSPVRVFNCSYCPIDDYRSFSEIMFLLLSGVGVGFSVQQHHVENLPSLSNPKMSRKFIIADSIEGWSDAVKALMKAYMVPGKTLPRFIYSEIRPKGAKISSGGWAPGPEPLRLALEHVNSILRAALTERGDGTKLKPLEAHDIICILSNAVLAGGVRRSALISLFSPQDNEMLNSKHRDELEGKEWRYRANNSAVLLRSEVTEDQFRDIWARTEASNSGEPGIIFTNNLDYGVNPCLPGDETVLTSEGIVYIKDLVSKPFNTIINNQEYTSTAEGFFSTGTQPVYEITTKEGYKLRATSNHLIRTSQKSGRKSREDSWVKLGDLGSGTKIVLSNSSKTNWGGKGSFDDGWLMGSLLGDGTFYKNTAYLCYWTEHEHQVGISKAKSVLKTRSDFGQGLGYKGKHQNGSVDLLEKAIEFGIPASKTLDNTKCEIGTSSEFYKGFLQGWFDADGTVIGNQLKGVSVRLASSIKSNLEIAQRMLLRQGIVSTLYPRKKAGFSVLPDGKGGSKPYATKAMWELVISGENLRTFSERIGFSHKDKVARLSQLLANYKRNLNQEEYLATVGSIELIGNLPVYDCTIPEISAFEASGVIVHNCSEISLRPYQLCNLTEVNVSSLDDQNDLNNRVWAAALIGTLQASLTDFHYLRPIWQKTVEEDALLGVSFTGIGSEAVLSYDIEEAARVVIDTNTRVAKAIGINPSARMTCVKPSGSTSIVMGTSSGIHAWYAPYYLRRVRMRMDEPLSQYLLKNHPEIVEESVEKPTEEIITVVPIKAPEGSKFTHEDLLTSYLPRLKRITEDWIWPTHRRGDNTHNVSATIHVPQGEWESVVDWLWENRDFYLGVTAYPAYDAVYKQPPFEEITEEEYNNRVKNLREVDFSKIIETKDLTALEEQSACAGGACEITHV